MKTIDEFDEDDVEVQKTRHSTCNRLVLKFTISSGTLSRTDGSKNLKKRKNKRKKRNTVMQTINEFDEGIVEVYKTLSRTDGSEV